MKTKNRLFVIILFVVSSCLLCSCGNLSRSKAKNLILQQLNSDQSKPIWTRESLIVLDFPTYFGRIETSSPFKQETEMLVNKGYITMSGRNVFVLNPRIKPYVTMDTGCNITIGNAKDVNITGISGDGNYREVVYDIIYTLNPLGEDISYSRGLSRQKSIRFRKYDDGWRID